MSLSDPALFYEILSHISRDVTASQTDYKGEKQAFTFHSQALQSVNKRLSDPVESVSDGVIATIIGFACFSVSYLLNLRCSCTHRFSILTEIGAAIMHIWKASSLLSG